MANTIVQSSIGRKVAMALSGLFLISFLSLHFFINLMSVFSAETFNEMSHFMGYNPVIQFAMQPILVAGVVFHFVMGFVLELKNRSARPQSYAKYNGSANASWASRNMIISGIVVLAFLGLHFYDFWVHEMTYKYIENAPIFSRIGSQIPKPYSCGYLQFVFCVAFCAFVAWICLIFSISRIQQPLFCIHSKIRLRLCDRRAFWICVYRVVSFF